MTERTFTEKDINESLETVMRDIGFHYDKMSFHDIVLVENVLIKVESAIFEWKSYGNRRNNGVDYECTQE